MKSSGFTITEALVASVVFMTAVIGVMASMNVGAPEVKVSQEEVDAAYFGKQVLEDLRAKVDQRNWGAVGGPMEVGPVHNYGTMGIYTATYTVEQDVNWGTARKVNVTVSWP